MAIFLQNFGAFYILLMFKLLFLTAFSITSTQIPLKI